MKKYPSQEYLKKCMDYDPESGNLTWKERPLETFKTLRACRTWNTKYSGKIAGWVRKSEKTEGLDYLFISFFGYSYGAHRLAFLHYHGVLPEEVDHIDGNGLNNSIENLRKSNRQDNARNKRKMKSNKSGVTGVHWNTNQRKWIAKINGNYIGIYSDFDEAVKARVKAVEFDGRFSETHGKR
jgi:hypothetical protein